MSDFHTNPLFLPSIKVAKPFNGNTRSVFTINEFLMALDLKFGLNQISSDYHKICIFADNLEGKAIRWLTNYYESFEISSASYGQVIEAFKESFNAQLDVYDISRKIYSLKQKNNVDGYIKEFNQYKNLLPSGAMCEEVLVGIFIQGLQPDTRKDVRLRNPQTVYRAAELARRAGTV